MNGKSSLSVKEDFIATLVWRILLMLITSMQKEFVKILKLKNLGENYDLYLQSDTLLLADVFENFIKICLEIYRLDPGKSCSAPGLAWQAV